MSLADDAVRGYGWVEPPPCPPFPLTTPEPVGVSADWQIEAYRLTQAEFPELIQSAIDKAVRAQIEAIHQREREAALVLFGVHV
jgi:regulator of protease activity HflC (stomatin/prohibitin superfamily)